MKNSIKMENVLVEKLNGINGDTFDYALINFEDDQKELVCISTEEWIEEPDYNSLAYCDIETNLNININDLTFVEIAIKAAEKGEWFS